MEVTPDIKSIISIKKTNFSLPEGLGNLLAIVGEKFSIGS